MNQLNVRFLIMVEGCKWGLCLQQVHWQIGGSDWWKQGSEFEWDEGTSEGSGQGSSTDEVREYSA